MDKMEKQVHRKRVHHVLAHSYVVYFMALIFGLVFSAFVPIKFFFSVILMNMSGIILLLSSVLILWAEKSSKKFNKENLNRKSFMNGPYRFTRNPTNLGLFLSIISFGIIVNSVFIILFCLIAFLFSRLVFLKNEEKILTLKYGAPYIEYKKIVKF